MKKNLLHISITSKGGAGKAASNVYQELKKIGYPSQMITLDPSDKNKGITTIKNISIFKRKIIKVFFRHRKPKNNDYQMKGIEEKTNYISSKTIIKKIEIKPDFIFIYWISGFLNAKNLYEIAEKYNATIILSLTDMVSFTGGCHFALDCLNYTKGCGSCPGLFSSSSNDLSNKVLNYKNTFYNKTNMAVVVGTSTLRKQVESSFLLRNKPIFDIKYHVDVENFSNGNKNNIRSKYGIDSNKKVLFFGATQITQKRKGFSYLVESLDKLFLKLPNIEKKNILLLVAGSGYEELCERLPFEYYSLGFLKTQTELQEAYQLSDIFLNTSIDDIGPFMLVEAMLSSCIIVSYNVGLANDLIINEKSGYLVSNKNSSSYAEAINKALKIKGKDKKNILEEAYKKTKNDHEWKSQHLQYENMFNYLTNNKFI